jgi:hypothetical protein
MGAGQRRQHADGSEGDELAALHGDDPFGERRAHL